jgi:hypothetical protein
MAFMRIPGERWANALLDDSTAGLASAKPSRNHPAAHFSSFDFSL